MNTDKSLYGGDGQLPAIQATKKLGSRRRHQDAGSKEKTVGKLREQESGMTAKGLRKCRVVDGKENQNQVCHRRPRARGNRCLDFHIPAVPATTAMGKWKSKSRIPTFPQRPSLSQINRKRKDLNPGPKSSPSGSSQDWNVPARPLYR